MRIQSKLQSDSKYFWRFVNDRRKSASIPAVLSTIMARPAKIQWKQCYLPNFSSSNFLEQKISIGIQYWTGVRATRLTSISTKRTFGRRLSQWRWIKAKDLMAFHRSSWKTVLIRWWNHWHYCFVNRWRMGACQRHSKIPESYRYSNQAAKQIRQTIERLQ